MAWYADDLIAPSGGDYTSLSTFENAYDHLDISGTDGVRARIQGTDGTTSANVYFADWVTVLSASCKIVIEADTGYETDGFDGDGTTNARCPKSISVHGTASNPIFIDVVGIEFVSSVVAMTSSGSSGLTRIAKCLARDNASSLGAFNIQGVATSATATMYVGGCLIKYQTQTYGMGIRLQANSADAFLVAINNSIYECKYRGLMADYTPSTLTAINNAVYSSTGVDLAGLDTDTTNLTGDDADIVNTDGVDWTEPSTDDFTIPDTDSALFEAGTVVTDNWFTELCPSDFAGTLWRSTPSVGCFEYAPEGSVCWGHDTSVEEDFTVNFTGDWAGTGTISGSGDSEQINLAPGEYMESPSRKTGAITVVLDLDKYGTGYGSPTVKYKTGETEEECEAVGSWTTYSAPFSSSGWVKVRVERA